MVTKNAGNVTKRIYLYQLLFYDTAATDRVLLDARYGIGSFVSVFAKEAIHHCFENMKDKRWGIFGVVPASILGIASPLCMYGTIPIAASFSRHGMRHDWLAAFMMSSVLLNPQLLIYSTALVS